MPHESFSLLQVASSNNLVTGSSLHVVLLLLNCWQVAHWVFGSAAVAAAGGEDSGEGKGLTMATK